MPTASSKPFTSLLITTAHLHLPGLLFPFPTLAFSSSRLSFLQVPACNGVIPTRILARLILVLLRQITCSQTGLFRRLIAFRKGGILLERAWMLSPANPSVPEVSSPAIAKAKKNTTGCKMYNTVPPTHPSCSLFAVTHAMP